MYRSENQKKTLNNIFLALFGSIWICLDTNFENTVAIFSDINFKSILLFFRSIIPFLIFLLFLFNYSSNKGFFFKTKNNNINSIIYLFFAYFFLQLVSHYLSDNILYFTYYFYISTFLMFYFLYAVNNDLLEISFYISMFFLIIVSLVFGFFSLKFFLTSTSLNLYGTFPDVYESLLTISTNVIRSSGLARSALILLIPLFLYLLVNPINKKRFFLLFILSFFIYLSQSRLVIIYFIGFIFFTTIFFLKKEKIKEIIKKILFLILIPFLTTGIIVSIKNEFLTKKYTSIVIYEISKFKSVISKNNDEFIDNTRNLNNKKSGGLNPFIRKIDPSTFTSGRVATWSEILKNNDRILFGNGYLGGKYLTERNASNIFYYVYASGGVISIFLISIIILRCFYVTINLFFFQKIKLQNNNIILLSSIFYLGLIIFRGIGENSFTIFSIDLIIFIQSLLICEVYKNKLKS